MDIKNILVLTKNGHEILGSDGLMYYDRRWSLETIRIKVALRNERFLKNFPHKLCDGFYFRRDVSKKIYSL